MLDKILFFTYSEHGDEFMNDFTRGMKRGIPVAIGYFPVAFSFGVLCINAGLPVGMATMISLTNLTSSGQFAGVSLIEASATCFEISLTLLMINARYFLMSLSLSQKIDQKMSILKRLLISMGITDEIFALASLEEGTLSFPFMCGLIFLPYLGWGLGTLAGELIMGLLPVALQGAMGIALYAMFLALIIPASKKSKQVAIVVILSVFLHCLLNVQIFSFISTGAKLIIAIIFGSMIGAYLFPVKEDLE